MEPQTESKQRLRFFQFYFHHLIILIELVILSEGLMVVGGNDQAEWTFGNVWKLALPLGVGFGAVGDELARAHFSRLAKLQGEVGLVDRFARLSILHDDVKAGAIRRLPWKRPNEK